ncbi:MAG: hypothetical protein HY000_42315 [Planctomycetes bacterium]|nr:hypothetical protein [Planctomycetota bacterium]
MRTRRRELLAVVVLVVMLASYAVGMAHLGHSHDSSGPANGCALCTASQCIAVPTGRLTVAATVTVTRHVFAPAPPVRVQSSWHLPLPPRAPPVTDLC